MDAAADADAVGTRAAHVSFAVIEPRVGVVRAGQNTVPVEGGLVARMGDLELLVQAQVPEAREDAHDDSCCDERVSVWCDDVSCKCGGRGRKWEEWGGVVGGVVGEGNG